MLRTCAHSDCNILTLGTFCLTHEAPVRAERWPRGRPYSRRLRRLPAGVAELVPAEEHLSPAGAVSFGGDTAA